jgi:hypothetical protein
MIYNAKITGGSLRLRDSRIIANLLLQRLGAEEWKQAIFEDNVLQLNREGTIRRIAPLLRNRLEPMGEGLWEMVRDGGRELATQATFAAAIKHSRLLGDFLNITYRGQRARFAKNLEPRFWTDYMAGCRGRDPELPLWSDLTVAKLRSVVFSMLAEVGYIDNTKNLLMQNVFLEPQLISYLASRDETYVLRCMEVNE